MGRNNGTFRYKIVREAQRDQATGFYSQPDNSGSDEWLPGCECQIEKYIPAKQRIGVDGQVQTYNYTVFIPKYFNGTLDLTAIIQIIGEDGSIDEFPIQGVDNFNRKYIEVWG
ncbi:hypothetical protein M2451_002556 [Dysgonomonas sp. PFB1-18]|uniref:hypothetical protein n=1 Tax=unclassified Dysgonomonas TaxID=2630389 RepID=UPI002473AC91|nr:MULTISPECIES: hypothetical protein [unclassified Dysgonomonas]MDH6308037.1 hypothetical protein [Dysgonomonas sp. PF1-14]MDH6339576.1 hypothetical protein [Dysgonomonas sp. PF1-16]MDH6381227.1 hypothetical protein [Dysgonomonas sp. PFB1-18]MDH6398439.1 hypothetical protein [Dysgonomonas sp. PF1-23]